MKTSLKLLKKLEKPWANYTNILEESVYVKYIHIYIYLIYKVFIYTDLKT